MLELLTPAAVSDRPASDLIRLRVLSLGAGVQSTTLALMAAHGEVGPMPDCAIFSDTGWEPKAVYEYLAWLMSPNVLPFPIHAVAAGNIRDDLIAGAQGARWASIPAFTRNVIPAGTAMPVFEDWQVNCWPLIEQRLSRQDCLRWLARHDYPFPPKSACIGCPFHSDAHWRRLRDSDPEAWADAVAVDRAIRSGFRGIRGQVFLHRSAVPLDQADLSNASDRGQLDLWPSECKGICGV